MQRATIALIALATATAGCAAIPHLVDAIGPLLASSLQPAAAPDCEGIYALAQQVAADCEQQKAQCDRLTGPESIPVCEQALETCKRALQLNKEALKCYQR